MSKNTVDDLLKPGHDSPKERLTNREICVVLIEFDTVEPLPLEALLTAVIDLGVEHSAFIDTFVCNFVVISFGALDFSPLPAYRDFIDAVLSKFGSHAKITYSLGLALVGSYGHPKRVNFGFIHPAFPRVLAELNVVPFGEAHEVF